MKISIDKSRVSVFDSITCNIFDFLYQISDFFFTPTVLFCPLPLRIGEGRNIPTPKTLGIKISHNHAFRVAFNARLIEAGADCNERCLVLGHSMQTNERHYSFSDRRRVEDVRDKLNRLKMA